jgi:hemerythrin
MPNFKWNAAYAVYLSDIDSQHKDLFKLSGELYRALVAGAEPAKVESLMSDVLEHITVHFAHEEALMEETAYPSRGRHVRQHQTAMKRAAGLVKSIRKGDTAASTEALEFMGSWLRDHTSVADKMMGSYLRNRRRVAAASVA